MTHLVEMVGWPISLTSVCTLNSFHLVIFLICASLMPGLSSFLQTLISMTSESLVGSIIALVITSSSHFTTCAFSMSSTLSAGSGADPCSTLGGIIPHFYRFFGILKFWGGYSGFVDFSSFNYFENLGVYSGFNENLLKQLKIHIRMHKINN